MIHGCTTGQCPYQTLEPFKSIVFPLLYGIKHWYVNPNFLLYRRTCLYLTIRTHFIYKTTSHKRLYYLSYHIFISLSINLAYLWWSTEWYHTVYYKYKLYLWLFPMKRNRKDSTDTSIVIAINLCKWSRLIKIMGV